MGWVRSASYRRPLTSNGEPRRLFCRPKIVATRRTPEMPVQTEEQLESNVFSDLETTNATPEIPRLVAEFDRFHFGLCEGDVLLTLDLGDSAFTCYCL